MACKKCETEPVMQLPNSEVSLCRSCYIKYFEKKVLKTIRNYNLIEKDDHFGVALSGGKDSLSTLYLIHKFSRKIPGIKITALAIDEGIKGYREKTLESADKLCKELGVELNIYSYKNEFGKPLDDVVNGQRPCSVCGVLRRTLLNRYARELKVTKLATGHNLDDEAQSILMNQFRNNVATTARLGPITGVKKDDKFIPRIKPLYFLTEKEVATYAYLKGFIEKFNECPYNSVSYRNSLRDWLNEFEQKYPGTKHNIINSFIEILPLLKKEYTQKSKEIKTCKECGEPCSQEICQPCKVVERLFK